MDGSTFFVVYIGTSLSTKGTKVMSATLEDARRLFNEALALERQNDYSGAIAKYREALPIYKECGKPFFGWNNMGNCYFELKRYDDAITCHKNAIIVDNANGKNDHQYSHYRIALCKKEQNKWDKELQEHATACASGPDMNMATDSLGKLAAYYNNNVGDYWKAMDCNVMKIERIVGYLKGENLTETERSRRSMSSPEWLKREYNRLISDIAFNLYAMSINHKNVGDLDYCEKKLLAKAQELYNRVGVSDSATEYIAKRINEVKVSALFPNKTKPFKRVMKLVEGI